MSCLGVLFAIDESTVQKLKSLAPSAIVDFVQNEIEEVYFAQKREQVAELDKAWDAIQRAYDCDENDLAAQTGEYPLNHLIFGSEVLYGAADNQSDYIITLKTPKQVAEIFTALKDLTKAEFSQKYFAIDPVAYDFPIDEDDFYYTWQWLKDTLDFWQYAAEHQLSVIFTVDQ